MSGDIKLFNEDGKGKTRKSRKTSELFIELEKKGYDKLDKDTDIENKDIEIETEKIAGGYNYLLRMQFSSITEEKITKLKNEIDSKIKTKNTISKTAEKQLWLNDISLSINIISFIWSLSPKILRVL